MLQTAVKVRVGEKGRQLPLKVSLDHTHSNDVHAKSEYVVCESYACAVSTECEWFGKEQHPTKVTAQRSISLMIAVAPIFAHRRTRAFCSSE